MQCASAHTTSPPGDDVQDPYKVQQVHTEAFPGLTVHLASRGKSKSVIFKKTFAGQRVRSPKHQE